MVIYLVSGIPRLNYPKQFLSLVCAGLLLELRHEYPSAELIYRQVIQLVPLHTTALERLGRVYLRYIDIVGTVCSDVIHSIMCVYMSILYAMSFL